MSLEAASIAQHCKSLRLPAIGAQFASLADEASQQNYSHLHYLEALLAAEVEDRERRSIELRMKGRTSAAHQDTGRVRLRAVAADPRRAYPR
jgi:DNA replication protein DnaC